jgi:hypothetical protein
MSGDEAEGEAISACSSLNTWDGGEFNISKAVQRDEEN